MSAPRRNRNHAKRAAFLEALSRGATVLDAAAAIGVDARTAYYWRKDDPEFAAEWEAAFVQGGDVLAAEAFRRAVQGVEEPVIHQGKVVGTARRYSDTLLIFLLKAREPVRYCDRLRAANWLAEQAKKGAAVGGAAVDPDLFDLLERAAGAKASLAAGKSSVN